MNKSFSVSIVLFVCCMVQVASQAMQQQKLSIEKYITKAHRNKSWLNQLQKLKPKLSDKTLYFGVPADQRAKPTYQSRFFNYWFGNYEKLPKQYFLVEGYEDIADAFGNNHYELYFMPEDAYLYDVLEIILNNIRERYQLWARTSSFKGPKSLIAFIAIRTTPGVTQSPFDGKPMPRIIIGMQNTPRAEEEVNALLYVLQDAVKEAGCIGVPRYSEQFKNSCIFWAYGSADFKDSEEGRKFYEDKKLKIDENARKKRIYPSNRYELPNPFWQPDRDLKDQTENSNLKFKRHQEVIYYDTKTSKWYKYKIINGVKTTPIETEQPSMREARKILEARGLKPQGILKVHN